MCLKSIDMVELSSEEELNVIFTTIRGSIWRMQGTRSEIERLGCFRVLWTNLGGAVTNNSLLYGTNRKAP